MYYHIGKKIGTYEEAKRYILSDKNRIWSLLGSFLEEGFEEDELQDYILSLVMEGYPIYKTSLVNDALTYLADLWVAEGGWNQVKGDRASLGDFEYENWEEEEE